MGMFDFLNNNNPMKSLGPINTIVNPLSTLTSNGDTFGKGGGLNQIADPFGITNGSFKDNFKKGAVFGKGGQVNAMLDPAGIFGGNKGLSADQKLSRMLTGGLVTASDDSGIQGQSKNEKDNVINSFGTTQKPLFPNATESYDPNSGQPLYPGMQQYHQAPVSRSVWSQYKPYGGY